MAFVESDIETIGLMLEEKGLTHSEIDNYFEHHGVRGMKWGQRHAKKVAARKVAAQKKQKDLISAQRTAMQTARSREEAIAITNRILKEKGYHVLVTDKHPRGHVNTHVVNNIARKALA